MRVISQDGKLDFPYEICFVRRLGSQILAIFNNMDVPEEVLATYSTLEKAEMAMRKLQDNYSYVWKIEHGLRTHYGDEPCVFQFPQDDIWQIGQMKSVFQRLKYQEEKEKHELRKADKKKGK